MEIYLVIEDLGVIDECMIYAFQNKEDAEIKAKEIRDGYYFNTNNVYIIGVEVE